jgi:hypothetical protein
VSDTIPTTAGAEGAAAEPDEAPRSARILVAVLFVLLLVPGLIGFDAWPLTGWRLFSKSRGPEVTRWSSRPWTRTAQAGWSAWRSCPCATATPSGPCPSCRAPPRPRRPRVCEALLTPVRNILPGTEELVIARDHALLVEGDDGHWTTTHDLEPFHSCNGAHLL